MGRPRIIIADHEYNYIIHFQKRFVEEFFDKVELEIITDKAYFDKLFLSPQKAEILIVSDEFYDSSITKHNIDNIFLLMEEYEEGQTAELNLNYLNKYASVKEIFNEIVGISANALKVDSIENKETQIILVYSAAGGVGKTTVALGISGSLTKNYKKVLYVNADRLQSFQRMFQNDSVISSSDVYSKLANAPENIYPEIEHVIRKEVFKYLPPFKAPLLSLGLEYSIYEKIVKSAKKTKEYDFIVIDADSTFDEEKARLFNISDKVIVVTDQTNSAVYTTNLFVNNINGTDTEKYIFICNDYDKNEENAIVTFGNELQFSINNYINHINNYESCKIEDLLRDKEIQKSSFLII